MYIGRYWAWIIVTVVFVHRKKTPVINAIPFILIIILFAQCSAVSCDFYLEDSAKKYSYFIMWFVLYNDGNKKS